MPNGQLIAIVDDQVIVRSVHACILESAGFQTQCFATAEEFFAALSKETFSCIILDMNMPGMSGYDLQCKLEELGIFIPIVFVTDIGDVPTAKAVLKHGAVDMIQKPVEPESFIATVRAALRNAAKTTA
ncbi:MAG: response regulator [Tepidisphaeraceae bacterium]|jgi:FixJ family two-component response regulator